MSSTLRRFKEISNKIKKVSPGLHRFVLKVANWYTRLFLLKLKISGKNNKLEYDQVMFKTVRINVRGNNNRISIGSNAKLFNVSIYIRGNNHELIIGNSCKLQKTGLWFEDDDAKITIGDRTDMRGAEIAVTEPAGRITIGKDGLFAAGLEIRNGDSHSILDKASGKRINYASDVVIDDKVWSGKNVTILKGSRIGTETVIGTKSLISGKIYPPNVLIGGIPGKVIKEGICWDAKRLYQ